MKRLTLVLLASLLSSGMAMAGTRDPASWDNLKQLRAGEKIEVIDQTLKSFRANFVSVSDEAISLQSKDESFTVDRADVLRVSLRDSGRRKRWMLLGAAIGAGAALAITAPLAPHVGGSNGLAVVGGVTWGAAGVGLAAGSTMGYRIVYRTEKKKPSPAP